MAAAEPYLTVPRASEALGSSKKSIATLLSPTQHISQGVRDRQLDEQVIPVNQHHVTYSIFSVDHRKDFLPSLERLKTDLGLKRWVGENHSGAQRLFKQYLK